MVARDDDLLCNPLCYDIQDREHKREVDDLEHVDTGNTVKVLDDRLKLKLTTSRIEQ